MRLPRVLFNIQQLMVFTALVAILTIAVIDVIPDFIHRWIVCRQAAQASLANARYRAGGNPDDRRPETTIRYREEAVDSLKRSRELRRALYVPWELYGEDLDSSLDPRLVKWGRSMVAGGVVGLVAAFLCRAIPFLWRTRPLHRITVRGMIVAVVAFALGLAVAPAWAPYMGLLTPVALVFALLAPRAMLVPAILVLIIFATVEIVLGCPVPLWVYVSLAVIFAGALWPRRDAPGRPRRLAALAVVGALIAALALIPWTTRKPFLRALDSVKPGMTLAEARSAMAGYVEGIGWTSPGMGPAGSQEVTIPGAVVSHPNEPVLNADWGIVYFANGRVTHVEFSPD